MNVGDSTGEFMLIHALEREELLVSCGLPSNLLKTYFLPLGGAIDSFCLCFLHTSRHMYFNRSLVGARHTSLAEV